MVPGFARHHGLVGIAKPLDSAWTSSSTFSRPSVPCLMYLIRGTARIYILYHDSFSSTSMIPSSTVSAGVMMTSWYKRAIATIACSSVIAVPAPLAILVAFIIWKWASAYWCKSALLIADLTSGSIFLRTGTLSSSVIMRRLSALPETAVGLGLGWRFSLWPPTFDSGFMMQLSPTV